MLPELMDRYNQAVTDQAGHPLVLLAIYVLDFLAIHPVADGNGRLSRLLTTNELLRCGYGVARYVSVEQRIFESKNSYYAALRQSQRDWHEAEHDVWPWVEYLTTILRDAYVAFEGRMAGASPTVGLNKQQVVTQFVRQFPVGRRLRFGEVRAGLPGISEQTIRLALNALRRSGEIEVHGRGAGAAWTRTDPGARAGR